MSVICTKSYFEFPLLFFLVVYILWIFAECSSLLQGYSDVGAVNFVDDFCLCGDLKSLHFADEAFVWCVVKSVEGVFAVTSLLKRLTTTCWTQLAKWKCMEFTCILLRLVGSVLT